MLLQLPTPIRTPFYSISRIQSNNQAQPSTASNMPLVWISPFALPAVGNACSFAVTPTLQQATLTVRQQNAIFDLHAFIRNMQQQQMELYERQHVKRQQHLQQQQGVTFGLIQRLSSDNRTNVAYFGAPNYQQQAYIFQNLEEMKNLEHQCYRSSEFFPHSASMKQRTRRASLFSLKPNEKKINDINHQMLIELELKSEKKRTRSRYDCSSHASPQKTSEGAMALLSLSACKNSLTTEFNDANCKSSLLTYDFKSKVNNSTEAFDISNACDNVVGHNDATSPLHTSSLQRSPHILPKIRLSRIAHMPNQFASTSLVKRLFSEDESNSVDCRLIDDSARLQICLPEAKVVSDVNSCSPNQGIHALKGSSYKRRRTVNHSNINGENDESRNHDSDRDWQLNFEMVKISGNLEQNKMLLCQYCGFQFCGPTALKKHCKLHNEMKPFKCSICGKGFAERGNMTRHKNTHDGKKPFTCTHVDCGKAFTRNCHLRAHMLKKHKLKIY